jgi:hypothetical protein
MRLYLAIIPSIAMVAVIVALIEIEVPALWAAVAGVFIWGSLIVAMWPHRG